MSKTNQKIGCRDLYLAAYLRAEKIPLTGIQRNGNYAVFYFEPGPKTDVLLEKFLRDEAIINIRLLRSAIRELKAFSTGDIPLPSEEKGELPSLLEST